MQKKHFNRLMPSVNDPIISYINLYYVSDKLLTLLKIKPIIPFTNSSNDTKTMIVNDDWQTIHTECWKKFAGYDTIKKRLYRTVVLHRRTAEWHDGFGLVDAER